MADQKLHPIVEDLLNKQLDEIARQVAELPLHDPRRQALVEEAHYLAQRASNIMPSAVDLGADAKELELARLHAQMDDLVRRIALLQPDDPQYKALVDGLYKLTERVRTIKDARSRDG